MATLQGSNKALSSASENSLKHLGGATYEFSFDELFVKDEVIKFGVMSTWLESQSYRIWTKNQNWAMS